MNYRIISYILGWILNIVASLMLIPFGVGICYGESNSIYLILCSVLFFIMGILLTFKKPQNTAFYAREGFVVTAMSWLLLSITGAIPFYISGEIPSFTNAMFECISGFTTTGASILSDVEAMSHGMMFWRCLIQWIGGMGVLVFLLALLPLTGGQNMFIMKAESPGPNVGKLVPKVRKTAYYLYMIYIALTFAQFVCLVIAKMPVFDAICTSFTAASTGGFGTKNTSLTDFSPAIQYITATFLFLYGLNYNFFFLVIIRHFKDAFKMEEIRMYALVFFGSTFAIMANIYHLGYTLEESFRHAYFQVASILTTAGFSTADFNLWPAFSKEILVMLMFVGGCAGSTCGGIKFSRIGIYLKTFRKELSQLSHPRAVKIIKMDDKPVAHNVLRSANIFLIAYLFIFVVSILAVSVDGFDLETNFTAVASAIGNIGPGLSQIGPTSNFDCFSAFSKFVLMFDMLAGRLELFPMLILLHPSTWRKNK